MAKSKKQDVCAQLPTFVVGDEIFVKLTETVDARYSNGTGKFGKGLQLRLVVLEDTGTEIRVHFATDAPDIDSWLLSKFNFEVLPDICRLEDLPPAIRKAIFIQDCHVSGLHEPRHTPIYVCERQLAEMAKRILGSLGIRIDDDSIKQMTPQERVIEFNKIPRKLEKNGWIAYYRQHADPNYYDKKWAEDDPEALKVEVDKMQAEVDIYESWERDGFKLPPTPEEATRRSKR